MQRLDNQYLSLEKNLAFDEALVDHADAFDGIPAQASGLETLRLWEMPRVCVVVGRASRLREEVNLANCADDRVPVFRRCSGGAAVVAGPGCLLYSVLLSYQMRPHLRMLDVAHRECVQQLAFALEPLLTDASGGRIERQGTCDLTLEHRKFSGNALRCKRNWMLYHGTVLYDFPLELISRYLLKPPRQPEYRLSRPHAEFVTNLHVSPEAIRQQLATIWNAEIVFGGGQEATMHERLSVTDQLLMTRYQNANWHSQR